MITGLLNNQEATEWRHRWAERALDLLAEQKPIDAARLAREWNEITEAEQAGEESHRRHQESIITVIKVTGIPTMFAFIVGIIWGELYFWPILASGIVIVLIYYWLKDKIKTKLIRRKKHSSSL